MAIQFRAHRTEERQMGAAREWRKKKWEKQSVRRQKSIAVCARYVLMLKICCIFNEYRSHSILISFHFFCCACCHLQLDHFHRNDAEFSDLVNFPCGRIYSTIFFRCTNFAMISKTHGWATFECIIIAISARRSTWSIGTWSSGPTLSKHKCVVYLPANEKKTLAVYPPFHHLIHSIPFERKGKISDGLKRNMDYYYYCYSSEVHAGHSAFMAQSQSKGMHWNKKKQHEKEDVKWDRKKWNRCMSKNYKVQLCKFKEEFRSVCAMKNSNWFLQCHCSSSEWHVTANENNKRLHDAE